MTFRVFTWQPSPKQVTFICSGRERNARAVAGEIIVLSAELSAVCVDDLGDALKPIKGRSLSALCKRAGVKSAEGLADLDHAALQAAATPSKPKPIPAED